METRDLLVQDAWLGSCLGRPAWNVRLPPDAGVAALASGVRNAAAQARQEGGFLAAKVPSDRLDLAKALTDQGFYLADTNLQFRKLAEAGTAFASAIVCRPATPGDEGEVVALAGSSFRFSRFHLDANIGLERANAIKAEWTRNFFRGKRGTAMFLATAEGRVAGFVLLLSGAAGECVIDLIAVGESFRQRGMARRLCLTAEAHAGAGRAMLVGTQAVNTPAAGLYTSMGYRLAAAQYVFHFWA